MMFNAECENGHHVAVTDLSQKNCHWCGSPLTVRCPHGHAVPLGHSSCPKCHVPLDANPAPLRRGGLGQTPPAPEVSR